MFTFQLTSVNLLCNKKEVTKFTGDLFLIVFGRQTLIANGLIKGIKNRNKKGKEILDKVQLDAVMSHAYERQFKGSEGSVAFET